VQGQSSGGGGDPGRHRDEGGRIVAVLALAKDEPVIVAATRVRLNAMVASTSHAPLAAKRLETSKYHRRPLGPGSFAVPIHRCAAGDAPDSS